MSPKPRYILNMDSQGRITLPAWTGIKPGDVLEAHIDMDGRIILTVKEKK